MRLVAALLCVAAQSAQALPSKDIIQSCLDGRPINVAVAMTPLLKNNLRALVEDDEFKPGYKSKYYETSAGRVGSAARAEGKDAAVMVNGRLYPLQTATVARGTGGEIEPVRMDSSDWFRIRQREFRYLCVRFIADHGAQNFVKGYLLPEGVSQKKRKLVFIGGCTSNCRH